MTPDERTKLPLHVPQGRPITRTRNPIRPAWLDNIRRPVRIVAASRNQFEAFVRVWRFDETECLRILLVTDLSKLTIAHALLVLPGAEDESNIPDFCPIAHWRKKGGAVITIPGVALVGTSDGANRVPPHFPIETNMAAETLIAIAERAHRDSLNGK